ncbi:MAG: hypothetical protein Q7R96_04625, partial [Nanoarchaeota archaeon]|nr:hypothetical protein [Nanoarchaeota archaeon]
TTGEFTSLSSTLSITANLLNALLILFPSLIASLFVFTNIRGIKKYISLVVLFILSVILISFIFLKDAESLGVVLYYPAFLVIFLLFLGLELTPSKITNYIFAVPLIIFIILMIFSAQKSQAIVNEGSTLPEVYSSLAGLSTFEEMKNYCDSITISTQKDICILKAVSSLMDEKKDKVTSVIKLVDFCREIQSKGEPKMTCFTTIRAYRLDEVNANVELSNLINSEIQSARNN